MNIAIISSTKDPASVNITENLIEDFNKSEDKFDNNNIFQLIINNNIIKLYTINSELIFTDDLDKKIDADLFVFISKHKAQEGRASLTCHAIGNFGKAQHGGKDNTLCVSNASFLKEIINELNRNVKEPYEVTMEATHHGPYLQKPVLFVELGSDEKYWGDKDGGTIIAKSLNDVFKKYNSTINNENEINKDSTIIIGGNHYSHVGNKVMLHSNLAVGHICAKYNLENLDEGMIKETMEKCKAKFVLLDWKGLGKEKVRILDILDKNDIEYRRSDKILFNHL